MSVGMTVLAVLGVQHWDAKEACCAKGGAFAEGCSTIPTPVPCFLVDTYYPARSCRKEEDIAVCNRGERFCQATYASLNITPTSCTVATVLRGYHYICAKSADRRNIDQAGCI